MAIANTDSVAMDSSGSSNFETFTTPATVLALQDDQLIPASPDSSSVQSSVCVRSDSPALDGNLKVRRSERWSHRAKRRNAKCHGAWQHNNRCDGERHQLPPVRIIEVVGINLSR